MKFGERIGVVARLLLEFAKGNFNGDKLHLV